MSRLYMVALWIALSVSQASATVIFSQTFESFADGDGCTQLVTGDIILCRGTDNTIPDAALITVENAIPGYAGAFPSGSKVMRNYISADTVEADAGIEVGQGNGWIPASAWVQFAMYVNNTAGEVTALGAARPMKLWYPCAGPFPCSAGNGTYGYIIMETARSSSGAPFYDTSLAASPDNMYLYFSDNSTGTVSWAGIAPPDDKKLGQTSLAEWIKPGRWNIIRCHFDFSDTASGKLDCWIGAMGSALTLVASWHGGTTVENYAFTWTYPTAGGMGYAWLPSTQPANNVAGGTHYFYFDDYYIATSEADLPNYSAARTSISGVVRLSGGGRIQ